MKDKREKGPQARRRRHRGRSAGRSEAGRNSIKDILADSPWDPQGHSDRFLRVLPSAGNVLLTSHDNPDPDALASSLALQTLIKERKGITPRIAIGGILGRAENRILSLELNLDIYPIEILEDKHWDAIVMVDAQPGAGNANLPANMPINAVIDHHPRRQAGAIPFVDIRPQYGAVSTILVEYLQAQNVGWDARLATALFYAIKSETLELGRSICEQDKRAYFTLFDFVDWELLHRIIHAKIPGDYFNLFLQGINAARLYGSALVTNLGTIPAPDAVAEIADFLLRHENVFQVLVLGRYEDQLVFSIRLTRGELDAGLIAAAAVRGMGTGGGHEQMAGGRIMLTRTRLQRTQEIEDKIVSRFIKSVGATQFAPGRELLTVEHKSKDYML